MKSKIFILLMISLFLLTPVTYAAGPDLDDLADWLASEPNEDDKKGGYDSSEDLIGGNFVGGCGYQRYAFGVVNPSHHTAYALEPYYPTIASNIQDAVDDHLDTADYTGGERHEIIWGEPIYFPPYSNYVYTIEGNPPPGDCSYDTSHWILAHLPDSANSSYDGNMNYMVPAILYYYDWGDTSTAQDLFDDALDWWDGDGFADDGATEKFATRDIAYFLIAYRATDFYVNPNKIAEMEDKLEYLQDECYSKFGGGLPTAYQLNGEPLPAKGHSSAELNALVLLAYDSRLSTWHPDPSTQSVVRNEDAFVKEAAPSLTFNTTDLRVRGTDSNKEIISFLKFTVANYGSIYNAYLKLYAKEDIDHAKVYKVRDNTWDEDTITYNNMPTINSGCDQLTNLEAGKYYTFDVSNYVTGNGTYSFAVVSTQDSGGLDFCSKEGSNNPRLRINLD